MKTVCVLGPDGSGKSTLIPKLVDIFQNKGNLNVASFSSTKPVPDMDISYIWREQLISESSSNFERLNAARRLYYANLNHFISLLDPDLAPLLDVLIVDRGGSGLVSYNPIRHENQFALIPHADVAIYLNSEFEMLTERIRERGSSDFQDTNLAYRKQVWERGPADFQNWLAQNPQMKGFEYDTTHKNSQQTANELYELILPLVSPTNSSLRSSNVPYSF